MKGSWLLVLVGLISGCAFVNNRFNNADQTFTLPGGEANDDEIARIGWGAFNTTAVIASIDGVQLKLPPFPDGPVTALNETNAKYRVPAGKRKFVFRTAYAHCIDGKVATLIKGSAEAVLDLEKGGKYIMSGMSTVNVRKVPETGFGLNENIDLNPTRETPAREMPCASGVTHFTLYHEESQKTAP